MGCTPVFRKDPGFKNEIKGRNTNLAFTISGKFPNQVQADPIGMSLVSGHTFDVIVTLTNGGAPVAGHQIDVFDFDINTGAGVLLGSGTTASTGKINIVCSPVYNVQGTEQSRFIKLVDETSGESQGYYLPIWFYVLMDVECPYPTVDMPTGYTSATACGAQAAGTSFVALPASMTCGTELLVYSTATGKMIQSPKLDTGPTTDDPYWNGSGKPSGSVGGCLSDAAMSHLGLGYSCSYSAPSGSYNVYWRFS